MSLVESPTVRTLETPNNNSTLVLKCNQITGCRARVDFSAFLFLYWKILVAVGYFLLMCPIVARSVCDLFRIFSWRIGTNFVILDSIWREICRLVFMVQFAIKISDGFELRVWQSRRLVEKPLAIHLWSFRRLLNCHRVSFVIRRERASHLPSKSFWVSPPGRIFTVRTKIIGSRMKRAE